MSENGVARIHVDSEPAPEEMAAIVAAVGTLARQRANGRDEPASPTAGRDRWAKAGRREVLRSVEWERE